MTTKKKTLAVKRKQSLSKAALQGVFLSQLPENNFNIQKTCNAIGIERRTFYYWLEAEKFRGKYEAVCQAKIDAWEEALHARAVEGSDACLIFGLKTKAKDRGYNERETTNADAVKILEMVVAGDMTKIDAGYEFAKLGLPLPEVLRIEISKQAMQDEDNPDGLSIDELDRRYEQALLEIDKQRTIFLPERSAQVLELKNAIEGPQVEE